ncbi:MAG: YolD-like family protein [Coriobacteriaceae bacterium]|nr:YolD-like family protein [Coriobacteriaceae bacterium]
MPSKYTAAGRERADRAAQFMPFAALTGYYQLVKEQERVHEEKHELTEEEAEELSRTICQIQRGDTVRVTYYDAERYRSRTGVVESLEPSLRRLRVAGRAIAFDDILSIQRCAQG